MENSQVGTDPGSATQQSTTTTTSPLESRFETLVIPPSAATASASSSAAAGRSSGGASASAAKAAGGGTSSSSPACAPRVPPAGGSLLDRVMSAVVGSSSTTTTTPDTETRVPHHSNSADAESSLAAAAHTAHASSGAAGVSSDDAAGKQLYRPPHARGSGGKNSHADEDHEGVAHTATVTSSSGGKAAEEAAPPQQQPSSSSSNAVVTEKPIGSPTPTHQAGAPLSMAERLRPAATSSPPRRQALDETAKEGDQGRSAAGQRASEEAVASASPDVGGNDKDSNAAGGGNNNNQQQPEAAVHAGGGSNSSNSGRPPLSYSAAARRGGGNNNTAAAAATRGSGSNATADVASSSTVADVSPSHTGGASPQGPQAKPNPAATPGGGKPAQQGATTSKSKKKKAKQHAAAEKAAGALPSPSLRPGMPAGSTAVNNNPNAAGGRSGKMDVSLGMQQHHLQPIPQQDGSYQILPPSIYNMNHRGPTGAPTGGAGVLVNNMGSIHGNQAVGGNNAGVFHRQQQQQQQVGGHPNIMNNNSSNTPRVNHNNAGGAGTTPLVARQHPPPLYDFLSTLPVFVDCCLTLSAEDQMQREHLFCSMQSIARSALGNPKVEVRVHGSVTTGLALPSSDIDFLMVGYQPRPPLEAIQMMSAALLQVDEMQLLEIRKKEEEERLASESVERSNVSAHDEAQHDLEDGTLESEHDAAAAAVATAVPSSAGGGLDNAAEVSNRTSPRRQGRGLLAEASLNAEEDISFVIDSGDLLLKNGSNSVATAATAAGGGGGADDEDGEQYIDQHELENAEELYRDQIEKDYNFSTPHDLSPLLSTALAMAASRASPESADMTSNICAMVEEGMKQQSITIADLQNENGMCDTPIKNKSLVLSARKHVDAKTQTAHQSDVTTSPPQLQQQHVEEAKLDAPQGSTSAPSSPSNLNESSSLGIRSVLSPVAPAVVANFKQQQQLMQRGAAQQQQQQGRVGGASYLHYVPVLEGPLYYVQTIVSTRVPVIKLTDKASGLKVDITFAGGEHWRSMQLTRQLLDQLPQARQLILFLKYCVRGMGISESEPGGVTSFAIYLMVRHFYNHCKQRIKNILEKHVQDMYEREAQHDAPAVPDSVLVNDSMGRSSTTGTAGAATDGSEHISGHHSPSAEMESAAAAAISSPAGGLCSVEAMLRDYLFRMDSKYLAASATVASSQPNAASTLPNNATDDATLSYADSEAERQRRLRPIQDSILSFLGASLEENRPQQDVSQQQTPTQQGVSSPSVCGLRSASPEAAVISSIMKEVEPNDVPGIGGDNNNNTSNNNNNASAALPSTPRRPTISSATAEEATNSTMNDESRVFLSPLSHGSSTSGRSSPHRDHNHHSHHHHNLHEHSATDEDSCRAPVAVTTGVTSSSGALDADEDRKSLRSEAHATDDKYDESDIEVKPHSTPDAMEEQERDQEETQRESELSHDKNEADAQAHEGDEEDKAATAAEKQRQRDDLVESLTMNFLRHHVSLAQLLLDFCQYYGCAFSYETEGISFGVDGSSSVIPKPYLCARRGQHFHMTSPFDPEYDITARMTYMREFQWLCWWFATYTVPAAAGTNSGTTLQGILQWLSPMTFETDLYAVHMRLIQQYQAGMSQQIGGGGVIGGGMPFAPMQMMPQQQQQQHQHPQQQQQQQQPAPRMVKSTVVADNSKKRRNAATSTTEDEDNKKAAVQTSVSRPQGEQPQQTQQQQLPAEQHPAHVIASDSPLAVPPVISQRPASSTSMCVDEEPHQQQQQQHQQTSANRHSAAHSASGASNHSAHDRVSSFRSSSSASLSVTPSGGPPLQTQQQQQQQQHYRTASGQQVPVQQTQQQQQQQQGVPRQQQQQQAMSAQQQQQHQWYGMVPGSTFPSGMYPQQSQQMQQQQQQQQPSAVNPYYYNTHAQGVQGGSMMQHYMHQIPQQQQQQQQQGQTAPHVMPSINYELQHYMWSQQQQQQQQYAMPMSPSYAANYYDPQMAAYQQQAYSAGAALQQQQRAVPAAQVAMAAGGQQQQQQQQQVYPSYQNPQHQQQHQQQHGRVPVVRQHHVAPDGDASRMAPLHSEVITEPLPNAGEVAGSSGPAAAAAVPGSSRSSKKVKAKAAAAAMQAAASSMGGSPQQQQQQQLSVSIGHPAYAQRQQQMQMATAASGAGTPNHALVRPTPAPTSPPPSQSPWSPAPQQQQQQQQPLQQQPQPQPMVEVVSRPLPHPATGSSSNSSTPTDSANIHNAASNVDEQQPSSPSVSTPTSSVRRSAAAPQFRHHHHYRVAASPVVPVKHNMVNPKLHFHHHHHHSMMHAQGGAGGLGSAGHSSSGVQLQVSSRASSSSSPVLEALVSPNENVAVPHAPLPPTDGRSGDSESPTTSSYQTAYIHTA